MNRAMTWLAAGVLLAVGIGAVYMSTVGLGGTQAATTGYLTQAAQRGDVTAELGRHRHGRCRGVLQPGLRRGRPAGGHDHDGLEHPGLDGGRGPRLGR